MIPQLYMYHGVYRKGIAVSTCAYACRYSPAPDDQRNYTTRRRQNHEHWPDRDDSDTNLAGAGPLRAVQQQPGGRMPAGSYIYLRRKWWVHS